MLPFFSFCPDGWDCGYTYRYATDSTPQWELTAAKSIVEVRGVPLDTVAGGPGGGGKYTQILQAQAAEDHYSRITGVWLYLLSFHFPKCVREPPPRLDPKNAAVIYLHCRSRSAAEHFGLGYMGAAQPSCIGFRWWNPRPG